MPSVKVFVSSTCYDLAFVRESLRKFIISLGYEPVMSEHSDILYDPRDHTHKSCVEEVANCDLLVLIIGGRFGGKAVSEAVQEIDFERIKAKIPFDALPKDGTYSITHLEVLKAIECGIPVYTFIQANVYSDHNLYQKNKASSIIDQILFPSIEKQETAKYIFEFINTVRLRNHGNSIFSFDNAEEIENTLKKQWSSFFQKLLKEQSINGTSKSTAIREKSEEELRSLIKQIIAEFPREKPLPKNIKAIHRRILWVDDYPINNETVINYFIGQDIQFDLALSTGQAVDLYKKNSYDIIITDMGRGIEKDAGISLIKELNALHCEVPIVVYCSIPAIETYGEKALALGAYDVINGTGNIISLITDICDSKD